MFSISIFGNFVFINYVIKLTDIPSTQEGLALVVPATCPGKHEHFTVCDLSSILFLLQHLWRATTSHVPVLTCWAVELNYENVNNT